MGEEAGAEGLERGLDAIAQALAHAATFLDPLLVPALEQAFVRVAGAFREAGPMQDAVDEQELAVEVAFDDRFEVELDIGGLGEALGVAEQAKLAPVGDEAPERVVAVEELLDQGVRAALPVLAALVEGTVEGYDVDWRRTFAFAGEVGDGEACATTRQRCTLVVQRPAELAKERDYPVGSRDAGCGIADRFAAAREALPLGSDDREGVLDLLTHSDAVETEVGGALTLDLLGCGLDGLEQVGREDAAFDRDADDAHADLRVAGIRTQQAMMSGGSCALILSFDALEIRRRRAWASWSSSTRHSINGRNQAEVAASC